LQNWRTGGKNGSCLGGRGGIIDNSGERVEEGKYGANTMYTHEYKQKNDNY
jgi:hypothetical protein